MMVCNDPVCYGKAEAGASFTELRRKEGLEYLVEDLGGNTGARIADPDRCVFILYPGLDRKRAFIVHGIQGVHHYHQKDLPQFPFVSASDAVTRSFCAASVLTLLCS